MKTTKHFQKLLATAAVAFISFNGFSQITGGAVLAGFGVDADTKTNFVKRGASTGSILSDDWFGVSGRGVIDTTGAAALKTLVKNNNNLSFTKNMSAALYSRVNSRLWIDAVYNKDHVKWAATPFQSAAEDSTAFVGVCANGDDPANWTGGLEPTLPSKSDFTEVFMHLRRNGNTITDSLWLFAAGATAGTGGDRHLDIELYKIPVTLDKSAGKFTTGGPDQGHTQWLFDASGNITQTGDMIITISYSSGVISIDTRIWVQKTTYNTVTPALFNFGSNFNGKSPASTMGYASIVLKSGGALGGGLGNYSATASTDTTFNTPWGSRASVSGTNTYDSTFITLQYFEIGINLSRMGVDPALYPGLGIGECDAVFSTVLFKSRSSNAFTAALQDFAGPLPFSRMPVLDHSITTPTLTCANPVGTLRATSNTTGGLYQWRLPSGTTVTATSLAINRTGTYVLEASIASGCPVTKRDTLVIVSDSLLPVASASVGSNAFAQTQLFGGDPVASNYSTPFGGSGGLTYQWTGPGGFTSTTRNPVIGTLDTGTYNITVREARNGCTRAASVYYNFSVLAKQSLSLSGTLSGNKVNLKWKNTSADKKVAYQVEKQAGDNFIQIGKLNETGNAAEFSYADLDASYGPKLYRIKMINAKGDIYYSNVITINQLNKQAVVFLSRSNPGTGLFLSVNSNEKQEGKLMIYDGSGRLLKFQQLDINRGSNNIEVNDFQVKKNSLQVVVVTLGGEQVFSQKLIN